jgi:hypothetical protein
LLTEETMQNRGGVMPGDIADGPSHCLVCDCRVQISPHTDPSWRKKLGRHLAGKQHQRKLSALLREHPLQPFTHAASCCTGATTHHKPPPDPPPGDSPTMLGASPLAPQKIPITQHGELAGQRWPGGATTASQQLQRAAVGSLDVVVAPEQTDRLSKEFAHAKTQKLAGDACHRAGKYWDALELYELAELDASTEAWKHGDGVEMAGVTSHEGAAEYRWTELTTNIRNNMSATLLKLGEWEEAEEWATRVLHVLPTNHKALFRRGQAREELHKWQEAIDDLATLMDLDPANKAGHQVLERIRASAGASAGRESPGMQLPLRAAGDVGGDTVDAATQLPSRGAGAADSDMQGGADATAGAGPGTEKRTSSTSPTSRDCG